MAASDPSPLHRQVRVEIDGASFDVDEGLAPLIRALWERGYKTTGSCEHLPGTSVACFAFESDDHARAFARIAGGKFFRVTQEDYENAIKTGASHEKATEYGEVGTPLVAIPADSTVKALARLEGQD